MSFVESSAFDKNQNKAVDLRSFHANDFGPFRSSGLIIPFDSKPTLSHVLDLSKYLLDTINQSRPSSHAYQLSLDSLAHLVCVDSTKLKRFRSSSSTLDKLGIATTLKMVVDNLNWALDDCEQAYEHDDYVHVVMTSKFMRECYSKKRLSNLSTFMNLEDREQIRVRIRREKRLDRPCFNEIDAKHSFQLLASHELEVSTSLHFFSDKLLKCNDIFPEKLKQVTLSETNVLLMRMYASFPQYVNDVSIYDVPYAMFVDLLDEVVSTKSYIGYLLGKMPSQSSRWLSERHSPKAETQRLINLLYYHFYQYRNDPDELISAIYYWRNVVGHTSALFGRNLLSEM